MQAEDQQIYLKTTPTQVFSTEVCEIFKSTFFYKTPPVAASVFFLKSDETAISQL